MVAKSVLSKYLDPEVLSRVADRHIEPRGLVIGNLAGAHKSPLSGFAVEFAGHREYVPGDDVRWEQLDANSARATVTFRDYTQAVDITVAKDGQPQKVLIQRWSNANPQQQFRFQPFGGTLSNFRDFGGFKAKIGASSCGSALIAISLNE